MTLLPTYTLLSMHFVVIGDLFGTYSRLSMFRYAVQSGCGMYLVL